MQLKYKMRFMQHIEKVLWLTVLLKGADGVSGWRCVSGSASGGVDQLNWQWSNQDIHWEQSALSWGCPGGSVVKTCLPGQEHNRRGSIPGSGRSPGEGHGNPLQCSFLENPMGRGAWQATVHEVEKSQTQHSTDKILYHLRDSRHNQNIQIKRWKSFASAWLC